MDRPRGSETESEPAEVKAWLKALGGWQEQSLSRARRLLLEVNPDLREAIKWRKPSNPDGVPVWYHGGILCIAGVLKNRVRVTFPEGAVLSDPKHLFNACLEAGSMRAIDMPEDYKLNEGAFKSLVRAAIRHLDSAEGR
jgi:hypothetical protein